MKKFILILLAALTLNGCFNKPADQEDLKEFFANHKIGSSPDYAIVKNGNDYLATIHGYMDDLTVCLDLIKPLNENQDTSVVPGIYTCVPMNH